MATYVSADDRLIGERRRNALRTRLLPGARGVCYSRAADRTPNHPGYLCGPDRTKPGRSGCGGSTRPNMVQAVDVGPCAQVGGNEDHPLTTGVAGLGAGGGLALGQRSACGRSWGVVPQVSTP